MPAAFFFGLLRLLKTYYGCFHPPADLAEPRSR